MIDRVSVMCLDDFKMYKCKMFGFMIYLNVVK